MNEQTLTIRAITLLESCRKKATYENDVGRSERLVRKSINATLMTETKSAKVVANVQNRKLLSNGRCHFRMKEAITYKTLNHVT